MNAAQQISGGDMRNENQTVAFNLDEREQPCESATMRISPLRPVDRQGLVGDWHLDHDDVEPHRNAPTVPVPAPTDEERAANLTAERALLTARIARVDESLAELGAAIHGGAS